MNGKVPEKGRSKVKKYKKVKIRLACLETVAFTSGMFMFIPRKTMIFICRGINAGIANGETDRDEQGQTRIHIDGQEQAWTDRDRN